MILVEHHQQALLVCAVEREILLVVAVAAHVLTVLLEQFYLLLPALSLYHRLYLHHMLYT
jgi:hypothetical protein